MKILCFNKPKHTLAFLTTCSSMLVAANTLANPTLQMCFKSVKGVENYIQGLKNVAEQRYDAREINRGRYKKQVNEAKSIEKRFTIEKCMASKNKELAVFQCLADNNGHYPLCQKQPQ